MAFTSIAFAERKATRSDLCPLTSGLLRAKPASDKRLKKNTRRVWRVFFSYIERIILDSIFFQKPLDYSGHFCPGRLAGGIKAAIGAALDDFIV